MTPRYSLVSSPYAGSCRHTQQVNCRNVECISRPQKLPGWLALMLDQVHIFWIVYTEENPLLCVLMHVIPQVLINNGKESRVHLNLDSGLPRAQGWVHLLLEEADVMGSTSVGTSTLHRNKCKNQQRSNARMRQDQTIMDYKTQSPLGPRQSYFQI